MLPTSPSDFTIAMAGLELLPATRLKMACSLLAADRLIVRLIEWGSEPATLLVADETSHAGRHAIQSARQDHVPSIRINHASHAADGTPVLPRLATVREFVEVLKSCLQDPAAMAATAASAWAAPLPQPLLENLRLDRPRDARVLLESGLLQVVSDTRSGKLHMLRRMPLEDLLASAGKPDWRVTELSDKAWQSRFLPDVTQTFAIETLWWRLPPYLSKAGLPPVEDTSRLRTWPDLDVDGTPSHWLPVLAHLAHQPWRAHALAVATCTPVDDVQQVLALVRLSGLEGAPAGTGSGLRASATRHAGTILKMAKRFGLKLLEKVHG